ncbi:MAG: hypothetical protein H6599_10465 [Flavobacteriales bacterium]|nr:hypothetical protein [Flavobacteriales bacterium]
MIKKHILSTLLALFITSGAFAQNLIPANGQAEAVVSSNLRSGKHYSDGLIKHYLVEVDASMYPEEETYYLIKTSNVIKEQLGYPAVSYQVLTNDEGKRVARFSFSGELFTEIDDIKSFIDSIGFNVVDIKGTLHTN